MYNTYNTLFSLSIIILEGWKTPKVISGNTKSLFIYSYI